MKRITYCLLFTIISTGTHAQVCQYQTKGNGGGNWTAAATWNVTKVSGSGTCPNSPNGTTHSVIIDEQDLVTLNSGGFVNVASITLVDGQGSTDTRLSISGGNVEISGNLTLGAKTQVYVQGAPTLL